MKLVIIGNSGSGKTWLANSLATRCGAPVVHLDELFWEPGGFDKKRDRATVASLIASSRAGAAWIVEGVFGELAEQYLAQADALIWLDTPWSLCQRRLAQRGSESKAHMDRAQSEAGLAQLMEWASHYDTRGDSRSFDGHQKLFQKFGGRRMRLASEAQASAVAADDQAFRQADTLPAQP